jgi:acyl dehydratase
VKAPVAEVAGTGFGHGAADPTRGLNLATLGKKFEDEAAAVSPGLAAAFAAATEDDNPRYADGAEGQVAPPLYVVRPFMRVAAQAMTDPELNADLLRLVHGEQDMRFYRPLRPGDLVAPQAEILSIDDKSSGQLLKVKQTLMVGEELVAEAISAYFIRSNKPKPAGTQKVPKEAPVESETPEIVFSEDQKVHDDQSLRYAEISLDRNPIHIDPKTAEAAGLPSIILHGLCTMAFASKAVVNGPCEGESRRLQRLKVRFSKPVLPGWTLTTRLWQIGGGEDGVSSYGLETVNQEGVPVITDGLAEVVD